MDSTEKVTDGWEDEKHSIENQEQGEIETEYAKVSDKPLENQFFEIPSNLKNDARYTTLETLGEGGMGVVQRVKDLLLTREVALKSIKLDHNFSLLSPKQKELMWRLKTEAWITAVLEHPNIVPLYDLGQRESGELYFTMQKVEGKTLRALLQEFRDNENQFSSSYFLNIFLKICDAVAYAHSKGVIHRDLKPDNIMVGTYGEVYVMDWGIAKKIDEVESPLFSKIEQMANFDPEKNFQEAEKIPEREDTLQTSVSQEAHSDSGPYLFTIGGLGTPGYMSPEQRQDASDVKFQSDIFSLGIILKELFTLFSPIEEIRRELKQHETTVEENTKNTSTTKMTIDKLKRFFGKENSHKTLILDKIPSDIRAIIKKATKKKWDERYPDVKKLAFDIQNFQGHSRVSVRDYNLFELIFRWGKRNKEKVFLGGVVTLLLLAFQFYRFQEKQRLFKDSYQNAQAHYSHSLKIKKHEREKKKEKIDLYLKSFHEANKALALNPNHKDVEKLKEKVGIQLMELCFESEDYELARYVATELQNVSLISAKRKQELYQTVELNRTKRTRTYLERLDVLFELLQSPKKGLKESALLEISKMQGKEVVQKLIEKVKEGTLYFLTKENRSTRMEDYYGTLATALGYLESSLSVEILLQSLEELKNSAIKYPEGQKPRSLINYMVTLAEALANTKVPNLFFRFDYIRREMGGEYSIFGGQTKFVIQQLASAEKIELPSGASAYDYFQQGLIKIKKHDFKGAIEVLTKGIKIKGATDQELCWIYSNRGLAKQRLGDLLGSIADFDQALKINPKDDSAYLNRGAIKQQMRNLTGALKDFKKVLSLNPNNISVYSNIGIVKNIMGDYQGALEILNQGIKLSPENSEMFEVRGNAKIGLKDMIGALDDFDKGIFLNSNSAQIYQNRGVLKHKLKNYEGAIKDFSKVIKIEPNSPLAYSNRSEAKKLNGDLKGAIQDLNEAIALQPKNSAHFNSRGLLKVGVNDLKGAMEDYNQSILLDPKNSNAFNNRGNLKDRNKNFSGAQKDFDLGIKLNPTGFRGYFNRGYSKWSQGDLKGAIVDYELGLPYVPEIPRAYYQVGTLYHQLDRLDQAMDHYEIGLKLAFDLNVYNYFKNLIFQASKVNFRKGDFKKSRSYILRLKLFGNHDPEMLKTVANILKRIDSQENKITPK